jgi:hypothetical protein
MELMLDFDRTEFPIKAVTVAAPLKHQSGVVTLAAGSGRQHHRDA